MIEENGPLIRALIDAFLLLESSGPDEVDPDTAVRGMENMSSSLLAMQEADQIALRMELEKIAEGAEDQAYKSFVFGLSDMIGLASR